MKPNNEVLIIGGGLAGLTAAIHLSNNGAEVTLIEKNEFPKHKVCGEYISNEVLPYFKELAIDISELNPTAITKIIFSTSKGKVIEGHLPLGGFGISRYALDEFLYKKAISIGCNVIHETVESIDFKDNNFTVTTSKNTILKSEIVIGAFGKRSNVDQKLNRNFIQKKSPWLAVKGHYSGDFPNDAVGLHNFKGGYCGVSKVEKDVINICYLADYETFQKYKNIENYQENVVLKNPNLKEIFKNSKLLFDKPLTISQISFEKKEAVENHILMIGDTAGLIHPLCGNGMAMAIHSAKIVSELIEKYFNGEINSREQLEKKYTLDWNKNFKNRLKTGRFLGTLLQKQNLSEQLLNLLTKFPFLLPKIIKKTHGKPIY
ncbi:NAD(P)/FAD-dependent oxidoreductase [Flavobacterium sp. GT3R68]|uniref:NAD(P)/FAD-dependent oxidoreductase n=1 Tax=Flavobacterium sp. GT3R68 TaxID=2594437 RepID=UPI000F881BB4|nr:NAD(P)/FAD-dependent oxidoreductase [Flavobacterium sp. GT3R68]RTY93653.1 NAD(P)/FAD-dependent oxidoreductase [Flavobacterium sp. GSN2]TRW91626.1 NAD(P)/FAD-dependent oxidoreductase [Flavobacterium sp. GT3R68]